MNHVRWFSVHCDFHVARWDVGDAAMKCELHFGCIPDILAEFVSRAAAITFKPTLETKLVEALQPAEASPTFDIDELRMDDLFDQAVPAELERIPQFERWGLHSGTSLSDAGVPNGSMGVDLGDYNLDGLPDLWVANYERESFALYRNEGNGFFRHVSQAMGVTAVGGSYVGWGTAFCDFDHDGDEDLFVANGHVLRFPFNSPLRQQPLLFENLAGRRLVNVAPGAGTYMKSPHMGRGVACGDLDADGDVDLVISHINEPVSLLSNESNEKNHWLALQLVGTRGSRDAVGAVIWMRNSAGEQVRQVKGGGSYASTDNLRVVFGLEGKSQISSIEIAWPSGSRHVFRDISADTVLLIREPIKASTPLKAWNQF